MNNQTAARPRSAARTDPGIDNRKVRTEQIAPRTPATEVNHRHHAL
jgi:hypothetical protein